MPAEEIRNKARCINENSLKNLRPAQRGEPSRNPNGRPLKKNTLISCIQAELDKISPNGVSTNAEIIAGILVNKAMRGDSRSIDILAEYTCVKPKMILDVSEPITFIVREVGADDGVYRFGSIGNDEIADSGTK
mgnify:CR=1 FL=1